MTVTVNLIGDALCTASTLTPLVIAESRTRINPAKLKFSSLTRAFDVVTSFPDPQPDLYGETLRSAENQ